MSVIRGLLGKVLSAPSPTWLRQCYHNVYIVWDRRNNGTK